MEEEGLLTPPVPPRLCRAQFLMSIIEIVCCMLTHASTTTAHRASLRADINQKLDDTLQRLAGILLRGGDDGRSVGKLPLRTCLSPLTTTDGWRRARYVKRKVENVLVSNLTMLRTWFQVGVRLSLKETSEFGKPASGGGPGGGGSGGPQARVTISERKGRMSEEQWLCLMVNVLGGVRYDEMDPGVKCFYNSIPIRTMLNNESMRGIGDGGGDGTKKCTLSFYLFIEAVARVADVDQFESLSKNMAVKFAEWESKRVSGSLLKL